MYAGNHKSEESDRNSLSKEQKANVGNPKKTKHRKEVNSRWVEALYGLFLLDKLPCTALWVVGHLIAQLAPQSSAGKLLQNFPHLLTRLKLSAQTSDGCDFKKVLIAYIHVAYRDAVFADLTLAWHLPLCESLICQ